MPREDKTLSPRAIGQMQLGVLEQTIAYESARSDIECSCPACVTSDLRNVTWYDLSAPEEAMRPYVLMAERYLELRGLLERHPSEPELVRVRDAQDGRAS